MYTAGWLRAAKDSFHELGQANKKWIRGERHHELEYDTQNPREDCDYQKNVAKLIQRVEGRFKARRQNATQHLTTIQWGNRKQIEDSQRYIERKKRSQQFYGSFKYQR